MKVKVGKRSVQVVAVLVLLIVGGTGIWFATKERGPARGSEVYLTQALDDEETKNDLSEGHCSEATQGKLKVIDETIDPGVVARAYESRALCFAFANLSAEAAESYEKAGDFYQIAGDAEMSEAMDDLAENNRTVLPVGPVSNLAEEQSEEGIEYVE